MKISIKFTHWGFFHGLPVWIAYEGDGMFPLPIIPFTGWWISFVVPVVHAARQWVLSLFDIDSPERDCWAIERVRELKRPRVRVFDWSEEACREYQSGGDK